MKREGMLFKRIMGGVLSLTMTLSMVTSTMGTAFAAEKSEEDGYQIYPQVHYADYGTDTLSLLDGVNVVLEDDLDPYTVSKAETVLEGHGIDATFSEVASEDQVNLFVGVHNDEGEDDAYLDGKYDASNSVDQIDGYVLSVNSADQTIAITGATSDAAFYGLVTLDQILNQADGEVRDLLIEDYASIAFRGFIEGFYGTWSHENRKSIMEYCGQFKMNSYLYGPKNDPYHNGQWRDPYPDDKLAEIKELVELGRETKVQFVWAAHPGGSIDLGSEEDLQALLDKFDQLYSIGVRQFGLFFDDASTDFTHLDTFAAGIQDYIESKGDVRPLIFCPQVYRKDDGTTGTQNHLKMLDEALPEDVQIMWTGDWVVSQVDQGMIDWFCEYANRPVYVWWNYPVNDLGRAGYAHMGPSNGLYPDVENISGLVSNPMNQAQISKVSLFSVADYTWNTHDYDSDASWQASFDWVIPDDPEAAEALRIFSQNSTYGWNPFNAPESAYILEDMEAFEQAYANGEDCTESGGILVDRFQELADAVETLKAYEGTNGISEELSPWLDKMGNIAVAARDTVQGLMDLDLVSLDDPESLAMAQQALTDLRAQYQSATGTNDKVVASKEVQPFIENIQYLLECRIQLAQGEEPVPRGFGSFSINYAPMLDGSLSTATGTDKFSPAAKGSYFGVNLGQMTDITDVVITMDGTHYFKKGLLEWSADGKTWNEIGEYDTNIVSVEGLEIQAQYLRYTATDEFVDEFTGSPNRWINIKEFAINQLSEQPDTSKNLALHKPVTVSTEKPDTTPAAAMTDGDMSTRWGASTGDYNHVEYAIVDLGEVHDIARFTSYFYGETTRAYLYKIYTSIDGQSYELCVDRSNNTTRGKVEDEAPEGTQARYVKIEVSQSNPPQYNASLYEFEVYAPEDKTVNLALNCNASASADNYGNTPEKAFDGRVAKDSRWAHENGGVGDWLQADLGKVCKIDSVKIFWEGINNYQVGYKVQLSNDASEWTDVATVPIAEHEETKELVFDQQQEARYVRVLCTEHTGYPSISIYELEVYGPDPDEEPVEEDVNLALGRFATASADNYGNTPDKAVDGQVGKNNRWAYEGGGVGDWLQVDLRQVCKINSVKIFWEGFGSIDVGYKVQLSNDGKQWTDAATVPISEHEATKTITFEEQQEARYVRILCTEHSGYPSVSIYELEVYGPKPEPLPGDYHLDPANFAFGKTMTVSGEEISKGNVAANMTDGDLETRWAAADGSYPQWAMIDLGKEEEISQIDTLFYGVEPRAYLYTISTSTDGVTFTPCIDRSNNTESQWVKDVVPEGTTARYLRYDFSGLTGVSSGNASIYEVRIWAKDVSNINKAENRFAEASQTTPESSADYALDGDLSTYWASGNIENTASLEVTLPAAVPFNRLKLQWNNTDARVDFHIELSDNGTDWKSIYSVGEREMQAEEEFILDEQYTSKYVKLVIDAVEGGNGVELCEFGLYQDLDFVGKIDQAKNLLSSIKLTDEDTKLEIPEMPEGVEVTYGGTDYEQVIDANRNILKPLVDTDVMVEYKLVSATNPDETILYEVPMTVPGQYDAALSQNAKPKVLPELQQWFGHTGDFEITENSRILLDPALDESYKDMADRFAEDYLDITGNPIQVEIGQDSAAGDFYFKPSDIELEKETYDMEIGDAVTIRMSTETAAFWSTRTILQILKQTGTTIPKGLVRDYPKYKVRGFMFDVGRKAIPMEYLEMWVKQMSWYKMNDLNLHLSDNSFDNTYAGFRLESDVPGLSSTDLHYKKDEFRNFLLDSKAQGVNIVPEFDTPGHSLAFVWARPDLGRDGPNSSYLDVSNPETIEFIKSVWAEYMQEEDPVFLEDTVVNIGTDEYKGSNQEGKEAFRKYQDDLLRFIRDEMNHTPRLWGSQTENDGVTPITAENVQMYMWYVGYADAQEMYDKGYQMININDGDVYIVPGAGYYWDYLSKSHILNTYDPTKIYGGKLVVPAGDPQMLGGSYALWNDRTGKGEISEGVPRDNGTTDVELFDRMFDILPTFGEKLWSSCKDYDVAAIDALTEEVLYAPNTNPTYEVDSNTQTVLRYDFEEGVETRDSSANANNLLGEGVNVSYTDGRDGKALTLAGGESYVETPVSDARINTTLDFWVKRDADSDDSEQILFESSIGAIKAVQKETGKFGFSRDFRDYSFDYTLPKGEWVHITMVMEFTKTTLYVNGEKVHTLENTATGGNQWASLITPLNRIGSTTAAFKGQIDDVAFYTYASSADQLNALPVDLLDAETGVTDHGDSGVLPADSELFVEDLSSGAAVDALKNSLAGTQERFKAYAVDVQSGGATVTPNGVATISAPVPAQLNPDTLRVVEVSNDGVIRNVDCTVKNGVVVWQSDHFNADSAFAVVGTVASSSVVITYNSKDVTLKVNGEPQKIADLLGKYVIEDMTDDMQVELTFEPRREGEQFRAVTVNGKTENITGSSYTYTVTAKDVGTESDFLFDVTNKTILEQLYAYAKTYVDDGTVDKLIPSVKEAFMKAYDAAGKVIEDPAATQAEIDQAWSDLLDVIHYLDFQPGDKSALQDLYDILKNLSESDYTSTSWAPFAEALQQAADVLADNEALENDITAAYDVLLNAAQALVKVADRTSLDAALAKAETVAKDIEAGKYLPDGQEEFQTAYAAAKALDQNATQSAIDEAAQALVKAMLNLRKIPSREELKAYIAEMERVDLDAYTASSAATFRSALAAAKAVAADEEADGQMLATAFYQLQDAEQGLEKAETPAPNPGNGSKGSTSQNSSNAYGAAGVVSAGQSVAAAGAYVRSDTTVNFTMKRGQAYCFKMTVCNGDNTMVPSFTVGDGSVFKTQFVARIGNDFYYRIWAVGESGQSSGIYTTLPNGAPQKHCVVTIGA